MEEFNLHDSEDLKQAWQAIIKNTSVLDDETRSKVYSKLQSIRYYYISAEEADKYKVGSAAAAFYDNISNATYFINGLHGHLPTAIVHELLHGVSYNKDDQLHGLFFLRGYISKENISQSFTGNLAFNDGITEYLACNFLGYENSNSAYFDFVNIARYLSNAIGYEKFMTYYFNNDIDAMEKDIQNAFHLKDQYLVDKLFYYMDKGNDELKRISNIYDSIFARRCQEVLLEMEMNKILFEHKDEINTNNEIFNFIDIQKFYEQLNSGYGMYYNKDIVYNRTIMLDDFLQTGSYNSKPSENCQLINAIYKRNIKNLKSIPIKDIVMLTDLLNSSLTFSFSNKETPLNLNIKLFSSFLNGLKDENEKIDLNNFSKSQKFDFMTNILYNYHQKDFSKYFYPKDLVWYTNYNNSSRQTIFNNKKFVEHIYDEYGDIRGIIPNSYDKYYNSIKKRKQKFNKTEEKVKVLEK